MSNLNLFELAREADDTHNAPALALTLARMAPLLGDEQSEFSGRRLALARQNRPTPAVEALKSMGFIWLRGGGARGYYGGMGPEGVVEGVEFTGPAGAMLGVLLHGSTMLLNYEQLQGVPLPCVIREKFALRRTRRCHYIIQSDEEGVARMRFLFASGEALPALPGDPAVILERAVALDAAGPDGRDAILRDLRGLLGARYAEFSGYLSLLARAQAEEEDDEDRCPAPAVTALRMMGLRDLTAAEIAEMDGTPEAAREYASEMVPCGCVYRGGSLVIKCEAHNGRRP